MVSPSKEHLRPGGRPVTEGVGTDITPLQSTRSQDSCRQAAGRTFGGGEGPSLLLLVMLVFHQLRRTKSMRDIDF